MTNFLDTGTEVQVSYTDYWIRAKVLVVKPHGWVTVEQISDYEDATDRPRFDVAVEYVSRPGEPLRRGPFSRTPPPRENEG